MASLFKVQDGVELPEINRAPKVPRRKFPVQNMEPGQMFFVPGKSSRSVSAYISRITKHLPGKYTARHVWARKPRKGEDQKLDWVLCASHEKGSTEGVGVWRTE